MMAAFTALTGSRMRNPGLYRLGASRRAGLHSPGTANATEQPEPSSPLVAGKAQHTQEGASPRFVVTSLKRTGAVAYDARALDEDLDRDRRLARPRTAIARTVPAVR